MLPCEIRRCECEIARWGKPQRFGNIRNVRAATSSNETTCRLNRVLTNLYNQPIQNPLVALRSYDDASGLLPFSIGMQPCWAAFQKLFRMQLEPPLTFSYWSTSKEGCPQHNFTYLSVLTRQHARSQVILVAT